jgi:hypothetical protein
MRNDQMEWRKPRGVKNYIVINTRSVRAVNRFDLDRDIPVLRSQLPMIARTSLPVILLGLTFVKGPPRY